MGISIFLDCVWHTSNVRGEALQYEDSFVCGQEKRQSQVKFCDFHLKGCRWNNKEERGPALLGVSLSLVAFMWLPWKVLRWHFSEIAQLFGMITGSHHFPETKLCLAHWPTVPTAQLGEDTADPAIYHVADLWRSEQNWPQDARETDQAGRIVRGEPDHSSGAESELWW